MQKQEETIRVVFTHPRDSSSFEANVSPECTGQEAINGLVEAKFIQPPGATSAYSLKHSASGKAIAPSQSLSSSGVKDGDAVAVLLSESGAGV